MMSHLYALSDSKRILEEEAQDDPSAEKEGSSINGLYLLFSLRNELENTQACIYALDE